MALASAALAASLLACGPWLAGPAATSTRTAAPGEPRYSSAPAPASYLLFDPVQDDASLFSADGQLLEILQDLGWWRAGATTGAAASPLLTPAASTQIAYLRSTSDGITLALRQGGAARSLLSLRAPAGITGSIPAGYLAVSDQVADEEGGGFLSLLYVIEAATGRGAQTPVLRLPTYRGAPQPLPLAIGFLGAAPSTVYYTMASTEDSSAGVVEGEGLFVLDLATQTVSTFLDRSSRILGLSPDLTFVAFHTAGQSPPEIRLARLDGGSTVLFQPLSGAREVRGAVFCPDSSRIAWGTVVSESGAGDRFQIGLASTFGGPATMVDLAPFLPSDRDPVVQAHPVAWVTDDSLLIQVQQGDSSAVYRYLIDSGQLEPAAPGIFVTLFYP
jgi:hypothetical protein